MGCCTSKSNSEKKLLITKPEEARNKEYIIFVKTLIGGTITMTVNKRTTIEELNKMLEEKTGVQPHQQSLLQRMGSAEVMLEANHNRTLEDYNILKESTISMVLPMGRRQ
mmetsp:Transcript_4469/g.4887  ORF Transcript_4469/g.4887 Transcript_4469/m.4887 type:complete len:110 (+) Transcript_4469:12-341(+)